MGVIRGVWGKGIVEKERGREGKSGEGNGERGGARVVLCGI